MATYALKVYWFIQNLELSPVNWVSRLLLQ